MRTVNRCPNMNHGRLNAPVKYCPTCGESVNRLMGGSCDSTKHADMRRQRMTYCSSCGKTLASC